jgi:Tfp pilus assembly protein PilZ
MSSDTNETSKNSFESSQIEKRRYVRVPVEFTALIQQDRKLYSGLALNLSEDGLFLIVPELLSPSQTVDVTFRLPNSQDETKVPARVAWSSKVRGRGKFIYGMGVQIMNDVAQGALHSFVDSVLQVSAAQSDSATT